MEKRSSMPEVNDRILQEEIRAGLSALRDVQRPLLENIGFYTADTETMSRFGLALIIEIAEFVNETPWKDWKRREADPSRMVEEFSDVLAFLGAWVALLDLIGIDATTLSAAYMKKLNENRVRFGTAHPRRSPPHEREAPPGYSVVERWYLEELERMALIK